MEINFNSITEYAKGLQAGWMDKLGFVEKMYEPLDIIVDFGCADAAITTTITSFYPDALVIGYDLPEVLAAYDIADYKPTPLDRIIITGEIEHVIELIKKRRESRNGKGKALLVFNSVMHEIFNYMDKEDAADLLRLLAEQEFDYIWIRDMYPDIGNKAKVPGATTTIECAINQNEKFAQRLEQFKQIYGVYDECDYMHFLMKCRYNNWERELKEDYAAFKKNIGTVRSVLLRQYMCTYMDAYLLPYIRHINKEELHIDLDGLNILSHYKALFKIQGVNREHVKYMTPAEIASATGGHVMDLDTFLAGPFEPYDGVGYLHDGLREYKKLNAHSDDLDDEELTLLGIKWVVWYNK